MRTFRLERTTDPAGVSGTGVVAEGARFMTGKVCLSWFSTPTSVAVYDSVEDVEKIHGHGGSTRIVWDDGGLPVVVAIGS